MGVKKALVLCCLGALAMAGVAYGSEVVTNTYVISAAITPQKAGTPAHPTVVARSLQWRVSTTFPVERPANVRSYRIASVGLRSNGAYFPGCRTSTLATAGPAGCPSGSLIGTGFAIFEIGPSGQNESNYSDKCRVEEDLFNGTNHDESLDMFNGPPHPNQPVACPLPGGNAAIHMSVREQNGALVESFSLPPGVLHPAPGFDAALVREVLHIPARSRKLRRHGHRPRRRVGLFESYFCPPNQQRQVAITFTREDGIANTATVLPPCRP